MKKNNFTPQQQEDKQELMTKCGELRAKRQKLIYGNFPRWLGLLDLSVMIAPNVALWYTGVTPKLAKFLTISNGWTIAVLAVATFFVSFIVVRPISGIILKAKEASVRKKRKDEFEKLDCQIDALTKQIISKFGGDEKSVAKQCSKAYQKKLDEEAAQRRREEARERQERNESLYSSSSDSSSSSDYSSSSSSSSSQSSSGYFYADSDPNKKESYVDGWGREVAYRDGNRVYSSETHDYIGFVSGNRMYNEDGEGIGSFDENGKFTKY